MTRVSFPAAFLVLAVAGVFGADLALAQTTVTPEVAENVTEGDQDRYSLVSADGDILRIDRQTGTVSVCEPKNGNWRCNPVPLAEEAYLAEINTLAAEVERLTARLETLETKGDDKGVAVPPGSAADRPEDRKPPEDVPSELTAEDEEELDKVLNFTETAMRRFFGMVRELQKDLDTDAN
jgi:hypothetical protein